MKILVIGSGGREHALAWRLAQGARVQKVFVAPGNAGTAREDGVENVALTGIPDLIAFAQREHIYFTVVGPEAPLAAGIVDSFRAAGLRIFGPTKAAAQLESSKDFAKAFMRRHNIPTAAYQTFSDAALAHEYINTHGVPVVIKADGLAAGKGVVVAMNLDEAHQAVDMMLADNKLSDARPGVGQKESSKVVIEEFLEGEEASFIVLVDGKNILPLATSQDHKRLQDGDLGPNTGGMGAYSPALVVTPKIHSRIMREIIQPAVQGMEKEGCPYTGFLYAGVMIDQQGNVKTLEFNCRMGDPETQPILLRLKSDLMKVLDHAVRGTLDKVELQWDRRAALGVVLAAANYPGTPRTGDVISGAVVVDLDKQPEDAHVFHAATVERDSNVITNGGRVLCVTALGDSIRMAQRRAYQIADTIHFEGCQMRHDIGYRAIAVKK
ncbi:MAG: phosphoribosylamine--glycine ligase [Candidatus Nitrotoga sp.]